ncbi:glycosylphosphatidylinositol-alpha 1,4 mannosyltransferase I [Aspergillus homomorphus CBS 101889]|uniref:GPI mannosyltransferase 1 n=1 Tax=Aspergillus homomorphus (strain CBS 101889) TaxID=1450537 RepID=A0A395HWI7_ASPHC|nr:hypothetical protein BO97DRAFT_391369 [Aspergillus homomorphus CBS 101889]RAL11889.1 hypothetical protein BO97DRAFT_391369 [Aspergillus homomorphus CBS 101889]
MSKPTSSPLSPPPPQSSSTLFTPGKIYPLALILRLVLLLYGSYQDTHSPLKYTDIDYLVFTDAARFVAAGGSPYERATYRYTPLLSWALLPTTWSWPPGSFAAGKVLFAVSDIVAGWLLHRILVQHHGMAAPRALRYASVWLLNPMVANISTRGSSEGVLGLLTALLVYLVLGAEMASPVNSARRLSRVALAGLVLGVAVHVKIYPFVYGVSVLLFLDRHQHPQKKKQADEGASKLLALLTPARLLFTTTALATFLTLNMLMYNRYGWDFLQHTFLHHLTRVDHRHNFSVYASLLYDSAASSASASASTLGTGTAGFERWAFLPQLGLSVACIPLALARRSLSGAMLAQTFAFVVWNKVCTSQYFLWYLIFLPLYLPYSSFLRSPRKGVLALGLWVFAQALWLQQAYNLEFLGLSTFVPGLWVASVGFFAVNVWILGVIISDVGGMGFI